MRLVPLIARVVRSTFLIACASTGIGALLALAQAKPAGVPVPADSALFKAFRQLEKQPAYRMTMTAEPSDPHMALMMARELGFSPMETIAKDGTRRVTMHVKIPAMDHPGMMDDWEIRAVVQKGRGARVITSPALPRIMSYSEHIQTMERAMLDRQVAIVMAHAAAEGPIGAIAAANISTQMANGNVMPAREVKKRKEFFLWQCMPQLGDGQNGDKKANQLTDMRSLDDQAVGGKSATAYEFYVRDGDRFFGPVRLLVAKDTGLPLRIEMSDLQGHCSIHMEYSFDKIPDIEVPACMASGPVTPFAPRRN
jgi:hypothetical protein